VEAWAWLQLSDEQRAIDWRDTVDKNLTAKQRERAQKRLEELRAKYPKRTEPVAPAA
jgi:hypothetical protein